MPIRNYNRSKSSHSPRPRKSAVALIELLENRQFLSADVWTGAAGDGDWTTPGNWQGNTIPAVDQAVTFPLLQSSQTNITLGTNVHVGDMELDGNYRFINVSPTLDGNLTVTSGGSGSDLALPVFGHNVTVTVSASANVQLVSASDGGNSYGITKEGSGLLIIDGSQTSYTGNTEVAQGAIEVDTVLTSVHLEPGTIFSGNGDGGDLTSDHGTVSLYQSSPNGNVVTNIAVSHSLTLGSGSALDATISNGGFMGESDGELYVYNSGSVDIAGATLDVSILTSGYTPTIGHSFTLIHNTTSTPVAGTFKYLPEGGITTINGVSYQISYVGGSGHDVTLTVVPTPAPTTPTVAAAISPVTTAASNVALSLVGADTASAGESGLTYTWSVAPAGAPIGAPAIVFSDNDSNAAKNLTATFGKAGTYTLDCKITNLAGNSVTSPVSVTIKPVVTMLRIDHHARVIAPGSSLKYGSVALDQFGNAMAATFKPRYTLLQGTGRLSTAGVFIAGKKKGHAVIELTVDGVTGTVGATIA